MLNAADVNDVVPQAIEFNDAQVPLYNCICGFVKLEPWLLIVIVWVVFAATNLYHTSLCVPTDSQPAGRPIEAEELTIEPATFEQLSAEVNVIAPEHSSFAGGGV